MRHYNERPFDETVCDAIIANGGVKNPSNKVQNVCNDGCIKHGSDFSCVCDLGHKVQLNRFCTLVSTQTVHPSDPHAVYPTHLDLANCFFCVA